MKVKNVSSVGDLDVGPLGYRTVAAGEVVDVDDELGAWLCEQPSNWVAVKEQKETKE